MAVEMNSKAISKYYEKYKEDLIGLALIKTGSRHDAEEIVQDVFVEELAKNSITYNDENHAKRAIELTVANRCNDFSRKRGSRSAAYKYLGDMDSHVPDGPKNRQRVDGEFDADDMINNENREIYNAILDHKKGDGFSGRYDEFPIEDNYSEDYNEGQVGNKVINSYEKRDYPPITEKEIEENAKRGKFVWNPDRVA